MNSQTNHTVEKLSQEDLINNIREKVHKSRELIEGNGGYHIRRGMAHTISGYCEDIFALYVAQYLDNKKLSFYVDKVISTKFEGHKKSTSFKPDLAIVNENNVLTHYFDLKTNLGWNRDLKKYLGKKKEFIANLKSHRKAWITSKKTWLEKVDENGNEITFNNEYILPNRQEVTISEDLKYHMVVVFGGNINSEKMNENHQIVKSSDIIELDVLYQNGTITEKSFENIHKSLNGLNNER